MCPAIFYVPGCRNSLINMEARPLSAQMLSRRCVIAKLKELTIDKYKDMVTQSAGGLVILLPTNMTTLSNKDREVKSKIHALI